MEQEKGSIGFKTPSKEIGDAFNKVQQELSKKQTDWRKLNKQTQKLIEDYLQVFDFKKATFDQDVLFLILTCNVFLTRLGVELTETHVRLAAVEKAIEDLKLRK